MSGRTATHAVSGAHSQVVHAARALPRFPGMWVLACNGRAIHAAAVYDRPSADAVVLSTKGCRSCRTAIKTGKATWEGAQP